MNADDPKLLAILSYEIAYKAIPSSIYQASGEQLDQYMRHTRLGSILYLKLCQLNDISASLNVAEQFKGHQGSLNSEFDYLLVEYPPPTLGLEESGVLAPYYSAITRAKSGSANSVEYFILGQAPMYGTTLRTVMRDGTNRPLDRGCDPTLENFLKQVREQLEIAEPN